MTEDEFSDYFRRMFPRLAAWAVKSGHFDDAHDLAARSLESVWLKRPRAPRTEAEQAQLDALAFAVMKGLMSNQRRSWRRWNALLHRVAVIDPRAECCEESSSDEWPQWFHDLEPTDREVLGLLAEGYSVHEIAVIAGCSYAAAAQRLSRARKRVQALSRQRGGGQGV